LSPSPSPNRKPLRLVSKGPTLSRTIGLTTLFDAEGFILDHGKRVMTRERLAERIGVSYAVLKRWDRSCPVFDGDLLGGTYFSRPGFKHAVVYSEEIVTRMETTLAKLKSGKFTDKNGVVWLSAKCALLELLGPTASKKRNRYFYYKLSHYWRCHGTKLLARPEGERKPKVKAELFAFGQKGRSRLWFREEQILEIKASLLRRKIAQKVEMPRLAPRRVIDAFYADGGVFEEAAGRRFTLSRAAKESGISKGRLRQYLKKLPKAFKHIFSEGALPAERRLVPGSKREDVDTVLESDLLLLKEEIKRIIHADAPSHYKTADEICDDHGVAACPVGIAERIKVRRALASCHRKRKLRGRKACRPGGGNRCWSNPMLFDSLQLQEVLGGKDLLSWAREAVADGCDLDDGTESNPPCDLRGVGIPMPSAEARDASRNGQTEAHERPRLGDCAKEPYWEQMQETHEVVLKTHDVVLKTHELLHGVPKKTVDLADQRLKENTPPGLDKPVWDDERCTLSFRGIVAKVFKNCAPNQQDIIEEFHRKGWPAQIDSPFKNDSRKHHKTLADLNASLEEGAPIRFRSNGSADGVIWEQANKRQKASK
jgi:hypothetical protein